MYIGNFFENKYNNYVYIIAEISQNHDGSLGQAHAFIEAVSKTGVDAIKFQTHIAEEESTLKEPFRVKFSYEDDTRYDYWKRMEFSKAQWCGLYEHAVEKGLDFLSSPFSIRAFEILEEIGVPAWKVGSGEVFNEILMKRMVATGKPILISSGMSTYTDIERQVNFVKNNNNECAVFQCTTEYPCPAERIGLNVITELKNRLDNCIIGISDHSGTIFPSLAAVTLGAKMVEVHVTLSPYMFGPDVASSVTIEELTEMVKGIRMISMMISSKVDKTNLSKELGMLKKIFAKSIYIKNPIKAGHIITENDIALKKPAIGIRTEDFDKVIGKQLFVDKGKDSPLYWEDLEG